MELDELSNARETYLKVSPKEDGGSKYLSEPS